MKKYRYSDHTIICTGIHIYVRVLIFTVEVDTGKSSREERSEDHRVEEDTACFLPTLHCCLPWQHTASRLHVRLPQLPIAWTVVVAADVGVGDAAVVGDDAVVVDETFLVAASSFVAVVVAMVPPS